MEKLLLVALFCISRIREAAPEKVDWCALPCGGGEQNTMCMYKPQTSAGTCTDIKTATTPALRKTLLHIHNEYRNKMASGETVVNGMAWPKASDMRVMSWDSDLEALALRWVQQCSDSPPHDKCRRTPAFHYNGQNKGLIGHSGDFPEADPIVNGWYNEIQSANPSVVDSVSGNQMQILHFTQVVWAASYKLGCAAIHTNKQGYKTTILVCNYGPGGNMIGSKLYSRGESCSSCPDGTSCKSDSSYPHLCASESDPRGPVDIPDNGNGGAGSSCPKPFRTQPIISKIYVTVILRVFTFLANKFISP